MEVVEWRDTEVQVDKPKAGRGVDLGKRGVSDCWCDYSRMRGRVDVEYVVIRLRCTEVKREGTRRHCFGKGPWGG